MLLLPPFFCSIWLFACPYGSHYSMGTNGTFLSSACIAKNNSSHFPAILKHQLWEVLLLGIEWSLWGSTSVFPLCY